VRDRRKINNYFLPISESIALLTTSIPCSRRLLPPFLLREVLDLPRVEEDFLEEDFLAPERLEAALLLAPAFLAPPAAFLAPPVAFLAPVDFLAVVFLAAPVDFLAADFFAAPPLEADDLLPVVFLAPPFPVDFPADFLAGAAFFAAGFLAAVAFLAVDFFAAAFFGAAFLAAPAFLAATGFLAAALFFGAAFLAFPRPPAPPEVAARLAPARALGVLRLAEDFLTVRLRAAFFVLLFAFVAIIKRFSLSVKKKCK
jgi:hypothetical protein